MREIRQSGSVRGVRSNSYPYRDPVRTEELTVPGTPIRVVLRELFAELDRG